MAGHANVLEELIIELGVDREHKDLVDGGHGLGMSPERGKESKREIDTHLLDYLFLQVECSPDYGDSVSLEIATMRRHARMHRDEFFQF
jgi:hypothetical protein